MIKHKLSRFSFHDFDDDNSDIEPTYERHYHESDEDTEDASETDMVKQEEEYTEIKEQMYQDKHGSLKKQLQQLKDGTHPEYLRRLKKLDQILSDRELYNEIAEKIGKEKFEREYGQEQEVAYKEFEEKKIELEETLLAELEEKKKSVETERATMELTGDKSSLQVAEIAIIRRLILQDSAEPKPVSTRKLRRRPNDPLPIPEKRRKILPTQLNFLLDESDIVDDLKAVATLKDKSKPSSSAPLKRQDSCDSLSPESQGTIEVKVEDGKLYYDKKWYHRGQQVYYEGKEVGSKHSGLICTISTSEIWIKRTSDNNKIRIYLSQLQKGKFTLRRRSA